MAECAAERRLLMSCAASEQRDKAIMLICQRHAETLHAYYAMLHFRHTEYHARLRQYIRYTSARPLRCIKRLLLAPARHTASVRHRPALHAVAAIR